MSAFGVFGDVCPLIIGIIFQEFPSVRLSNSPLRVIISLAYSLWILNDLTPTVLFFKSIQKVVEQRSKYKIVLDKKIVIYSLKMC